MASAGSPGPEPHRPPPAAPATSPPDAAGRLTSLSSWTRGERLIVLAGVPLAAALWQLPWHRFGLSIADDFRRLGLGEIPVFRPIEATALENPNGFLGRGALVVSVLMVATVIAAKVLERRRALPAVWQQAHLVAGATVLGLLVAKVAARGEYLAVGAWLALGLAALLAYAGFARSQETTGSGAGPGGSAAPAAPAATDGD